MKASVLCLVLICSAVIGFSQVNEEELLGYWINPTHEKVITYQKANQFPTTTNPGGGGFQFLENGKLIVRQNAGWCGTPPISYSNTKGTWKTLEKNQLAISYENWMGKVTEIWQIDSLSEQQLSFKLLQRNQEETAFVN